MKRTKSPKCHSEWYTSPKLALISRSSRNCPIPSSTSGRTGIPASAAFSVRIRWQKLWKLETVRRAALLAPTVASIRCRSSAAALTL